ncbi:unnamed protein product [Agarophyton chilense]
MPARARTDAQFMVATAAVDARRSSPTSSLSSSSPPSTRSLSDLTDDDARVAVASRLALPDDAMAAIVPSSPYVRSHTFVRDDDADHSVEYVASDRFAQWDVPRDVPPRSSPWRLLPSWAALRGKRPPLERAVHDATLASAAPSRKRARQRARTLFLRPYDTRTHWMEFSCALSVERVLAEVASVVKTLHYDVWRRAGENKLRCVRRISDAHHMHVVVVVGCVALPRASLSVVRLRRAKGDRNRTEHWRFQVLFRELVDRLRASGVDVRSEQS